MNLIFTTDCQTFAISVIIASLSEKVDILVGALLALITKKASWFNVRYNNS
jgi:hypothetical protein